MKPNISLILPESTHEVELHYKRPVFNTMFGISSADDAYTCVKKFVNPKRIDLKEFFWILLLTNANHVVAIAEISSGTSKSVLVNIKEIFQLILKTNAAALIVCHNHPSGKLNVSESDKQLTKKISEASLFFDITFLDHIIITSESYISFSEESLM